MQSDQEQLRVHELVQKILLSALQNTYSLRPTLSDSISLNMDVIHTKTCLDTCNVSALNMGRREYIIQNYYHAVNCSSRDANGNHAVNRFRTSRTPGLDNMS